MNLSYCLPPGTSKHFDKYYTIQSSWHVSTMMLNAKLNFDVFEANEEICVKTNMAEKYYKMGWSALHCKMSIQNKDGPDIYRLHDWKYITTHND